MVFKLSAKMFCKICVEARNNVCTFAIIVFGYERLHLWNRGIDEYCLHEYCNYEDTSQYDNDF